MAADDPTKASQQESLERAKQAAREGDPLAMIEALHHSRALDGLSRTLGRSWSGQVPGPEIDDCLAWAVDQAYAQLRDGKKILNLVAFIWKCGENRITDRWRQDYSKRAGTDPATLAVDVREAPSPSVPEETHAAARAEALRIARELLPQLGEANIVAVMSMVFDAVAADVTDLPAALIADALGLAPGTVRVLIHRGFRRLERLAAARGLHVNRFANHFEEEPNGD